MDCLSNHLFWSGRMELRHSPARPPGGRCLGRRTSGAWPLTPPRPCLLTSVPQPSPRPPLPWERFRVMVSLTRDLWHPRSHVRVCSAHVSPRGASQFRRCVKTCHSIRRYSLEEHDRNRGKRPASSDQVQLFCTTKRDEWVGEVCWAWSQGFQCHKGGSLSTWLHRHGNLYVAPYLVQRRSCSEFLVQAHLFLIISLMMFPSQRQFSAEGIHYSCKLSEPNFSDLPNKAVR